MTCSICQSKNATIRITDIAHEEKTLYICQDCRKNIKQIDLFCQKISVIKDKFALPLDSKNKNELNLLKAPHQLANKKNITDEKCPDCGITLQEILINGTFGCEKDFDVFQAQLKNILKDLHGKSKHTGNHPPITEKEKTHNYITTLEYDLQKAIEQENYELAGELSKRIKELKNEA